MFETHNLLAKLRRRYGHFFIARLCLKLGREIPEHIMSDQEDREWAARVRKACRELGVADPPDSQR